MAQPLLVRSSSSVAAALAVVAAFAAGPAAAREAARIETPGAALGLSVGRVVGDTVELALSIDLKPGWKTYWRTPGDAGIPPRIALADTAARDLAVSYPTPHRFGPADAPSLGYSGVVILPLTLRLADPAKSTRVALQVMIGLCKDICVPVAETVAVDVGASASAEGARLVARGREAVPAIVRPGAALAVAAIRRADAADPALEVEIAPGGEGPVRDVFVEAGDDWVLPQPTRLGDADGRSRWRIVLADAPKGQAVDGATLTLTVVGAKGAGEQVIRVPQR